MSFSSPTRQRIRAAACALACCAILAPTASAMIPDPGNGRTQPSAAVRPDDRATRGVPATIEPGDLGYYTHGLGATASDAGIVDFAAGPAAARRVTLFDQSRTADRTSAPVSGTPGAGFDWGDAGAGIGIGVFAGILLVLASLARRRRGTLAGV